MQIDALRGFRFFGRVRSFGHIPDDEGIDWCARPPWLLHVKKIRDLEQKTSSGQSRKGDGPVGVAVERGAAAEDSNLLGASRQAEHFSGEGGAFLNHVDVEDLTNGNVIQQGQNQVRTAAPRVNLDGRGQSMTERRWPDESLRGEAPGVPRRDVPRLAVFAENGIGKIDETFASDDHGLLARFRARRDLQVGAVAHANDIVLVVRASGMDFATAGPVRHGRSRSLAHLQ